MRPSVIHRKVTESHWSQWGADLFGAVRFVIGSDALRDPSPFEAVAASLRRTAS